MKTLILISGFLFGSLPGLAQILGPISFFPADLKQYLSLTDTQVNAIVQLTSDYSQMAFDKQQRIFQVQNEIADENRKDPLDPMALGQRYAEIEWTRRDLGKQLTTLRDKIR